MHLQLEWSTCLPSCLLAIVTRCYIYYAVANWNSIIINDSWKEGTAGGCRDYPTFANNPQYVVELHEDADGDGKCSILIALMQKNRKKQRKMGIQDLCIGYAIYKVDTLS